MKKMITCLIASAFSNVSLALESDFNLHADQILTVAEAVKVDCKTLLDQKIFDEIKNSARSRDFICATTIKDKSMIKSLIDEKFDRRVFKDWQETTVSDVNFELTILNFDVFESGIFILIPPAGDQLVLIESRGRF